MKDPNHYAGPEKERPLRGRGEQVRQSAATCPELSELLSLKTHMRQLVSQNLIAEYTQHA